jgi:hypothetical protein
MSTSPNAALEAGREHIRSVGGVTREGGIWSVIAQFREQPAGRKGSPKRQ